MLLDRRTNSSIYSCVRQHPHQPVTQLSPGTPGSCERSGPPWPEHHTLLSGSCGIVESNSSSPANFANCGELRRRRTAPRWQAWVSRVRQSTAPQQHGASERWAEVGREARTERYGGSGERPPPARPCRAALPGSSSGSPACPTGPRIAGVRSRCKHRAGRPCGVSCMRHGRASGTVRSGRTGTQGARG